MKFQIGEFRFQIADSIWNQPETDLKSENLKSEIQEQ